MPSKLPKSISPNPLINTTVEVRFASTLEAENVLNFYLDLLRDELPKVYDRRLPQISGEIQDPRMKYAANYIFQNDDFSVSADHNIISFGNVGTYKFWDHYFPFIKKTLLKLSNTGVVQKIERIGLRYASFLPYKSEDLPIVNLEVSFDLDDYKRRNDFLRSEFFNDRYTLIFQLKRYVKDNENNDGVLIDIDAVCTDNIPQIFNDDFFEIIDNLHSEEKKFFFDLLHPDYLATLNPTY